jgi:predicted phosphodiesterase
MKVQLLSDLHLEQFPDFVPRAAPGVDTLVLAGDIGSYHRGSRLIDQDFGLGRFSPLTVGSPWRTVLYVPGNHEYDDLEFEPTRARLRDTCARLGITWLEQERIVVDGVRFVGATLWADFDALARHPPRAAALARYGTGETPLTWQMRQREKAFRAANYYLATNTTFRDGKPMLAETIRELSLASQDWLRRALTEPFDGTTVAVTHFAPSLRSHDPRYGVTPGTAGFCNALDDLLPLADVWLHGHLHCPHDYLVEGTHDGAPFRCRVVANPLGYADKGEQAAFDPSMAIELPDAPPRLR